MNFGLFLVFFVYGLAFFCMGLAISLESRRSPLLADGRVLLPLAAFGILHGSHEWVEMFQGILAWEGYAVPPALVWGRYALLAISFSTLALFGLLALQRPGANAPIKPVYLLATWIGGYAILVAFGMNALPVSDGSPARYADIMARYLLAVPAALLAAWVLWRQSRQLKKSPHAPLAAGLNLAALCLMLYGLTQIVVPPADFFPANTLNSANFLAWTGIPIQGGRALLAVLATVGIVRATQAAEKERQKELAAAQTVQLETLERLHEELKSRESMRKELLRHTVVAQEDERARIARELHDETAQLLTALSLELATLRETRAGDASAVKIIDRMQAFIRQMSQGIYRMIGDLRPAQLDDLGLVPALRYLTDQARQRNGLDVTLAIKGNPHDLELLIETVLFRIAQEALSNVWRHAEIRQAQMTLDYRPDEIILTIQDKGKGFNSEEELRPPRGWGIAGMRERAESVGGTFRVESAPGRGTLVEAAVPLPEGIPAEEEVETYEPNPVDVGR
jgi:signal transduction histidine kinase